MNRDRHILNAVHIARQRFANGGDALARWRDLNTSADKQLSDTAKRLFPQTNGVFPTLAQQPVPPVDPLRTGYVQPNNYQPPAASQQGGAGGPSVPQDALAYYQSYDGGGGGDSFGASYGNAPSGQQPSNMPDAIDLTTGQPQQSTNPISTAFNNAVSNPASTAINAAVGFIPGIGLLNTAAGVANMFGAGLPMAGSLATGTYGQQAAPAGMPGVIDLNTSPTSIGPGRSDATLSNIADKNNSAVIGVGPYGPYTQADVNAMANMMAGEASNQGVKGMAAVGAVAGNRAVSNYNGYGKNLQSQIGKPGQFLGYNSNNANSIMKGTDPQSKAVANQALSTAQGVLSGGIPSPVGTATDFNKASPSYNTANKGTNATKMGDHTFFNAPANVSGQTPRDQAVQNSLNQIQQQQQQQQQTAPPAPSGQAKGDGSISGEFGAFGAAPSAAPSGQSAMDGTISGETGAFGAAPGAAPSGQAANDGTIGGETGAFGAGIGASGLSGTAANDGTIGGETGAFGAVTAGPSQSNSPSEGPGAAPGTGATPGGATPGGTPGGATPASMPSDITPNDQEMGQADEVAAVAAPSVGTQVASIAPETITDAVIDAPDAPAAPSAPAAPEAPSAPAAPSDSFGLSDGTIGGSTFGSSETSTSGTEGATNGTEGTTGSTEGASTGNAGFGDGSIGGETGSFGAGFGDGSIGGEGYGGSWGDSSSSSSDSSSSDGSSSSSDGSSSDGSSSDGGSDGGGDGGGGGGGDGGGGEKRGGFIAPRPDHRIVHHALHVLHRASGGMTDSPELRARLHELGSRAYDYGHGSFLPNESNEYNDLTNYYNFPRYVGSGHMTREDEDAAMLQHLQGNMSRERLEGSYADGGIVDKALEAVGGQQVNPVAMAKNVATVPAARQLSPLGLYSQGAEVAANLPQAKGSPQQMKAMLTGVKKEELAGYDNAFVGKKSVTKDEIAEHFNQNMPQVEEHVFHANDGGTNFGTEDLTLPGGENYREIALTLPGYQIYKAPSAHRMSDKADINRLAHLRMSDRTGSNGEKVLHVEEMQSDWGQQGRKAGFVGKYKPEDIELMDPSNITSERRRNEFWNFKTPTGAIDIPKNNRYPTVEDAKQHILNNARPSGIPSAPYVTKTEGWTDLALKRALKEAAEGGYDKLVWTPGIEQAKRYPDGGVEREEGMKGYYDNIVPKRLQELVKKHDPDARVGEHEIPNSGDTRRKGYADVGDMMNWHPAYTNLSRQEQSARWNEMTPVHRRQLIKDYENSQSGDITGHGIDITPKMRESILKGQSAFKRGGSVSSEQAGLQRRMQSILRPDSDDPEMVQKYLQARASYDMPTHERGAYSARVLPMAAHNVQTTIGPLGNAVPKQAQALTWNGFHKIGKGGTLFTLGGDRSNLGRLTHINGKEMAWPVDLHAGTKYMAEPNLGAVWANAKGAATALRKNIREASQKGPVYGAFAAMGPTAVDSANNMFDVLMAQVPGSGISKTDAKAFDDSLREGKHIKGSDESDIKKRETAKEIMKNWPGIQNAEKARDFARTLAGAQRGAIVKHMETAPWQNAGFPSVGITRAAITDPELLGVSGNMMGHHVVELDPDVYNRKDLQFEHSTYGYPTKGKLIGKLPFIERQVATPDFTEQQVMDKAVVKKTGEPLIIHPYSPNALGRASYRGNTEMRQAIQPINDRMLESIQQEHGTSFAGGGKAKSKGDASIVKHALMLTSKKA